MALPPYFSLWQPQISPPWLQGPYGRAWETSQGAMKDALLDTLKNGVKARFVTIAPSDAINAIGTERGIDRGTGETDAAYAARVQDAWTAWQYAGTALGILSQLKALGYPNVVIAQVNRRYFYLDGSGNLVVVTLIPGSWLIDVTQDFWSKFQVLLIPRLPTAWLAGGLTSTFHGGFASGTAIFGGTPTADYRIVTQIIVGGPAGTATYQWSSDGGATWSSTLTTPTSATALGTTGVTVRFSGTFVTSVPNEIYSVAPTFNVPADNSAESLRIKNVVNKWKPAHATCAGYVIVTNGQTWGWPATQTWGADFWGGDAQVTWTG